MAVIKENQTDSEGVIKITNGDFQALKKIKEDYHLSDVSDVVVFALGILSQSEGRPVTIQKNDGSNAMLVPSDKLRG